MRRIWYGPPNWLVDKFSAEDRRAFGFWTILSIVALIPNYASETPVQTEG